MESIIFPSTSPRLENEEIQENIIEYIAPEPLLPSDPKEQLFNLLVMKDIINIYGEVTEKYRHFQLPGISLKYHNVLFQELYKNQSLVLRNGKIIQYCMGQTMGAFATLARKKFFPNRRFFHLQGISLLHLLMNKLPGYTKEVFDNLGLQEIETTDSTFFAPFPLLVNMRLCKQHEQCLPSLEKISKSALHCIKNQIRLCQEEQVTDLPLQNHLFIYRSEMKTSEKSRKVPLDAKGRVLIELNIEKPNNEGRIWWRLSNCEHEEPVLSVDGLFLDLTDLLGQTPTNYSAFKTERIYCTPQSTNWCPLQCFLDGIFGFVRGNNWISYMILYTHGLISMEPCNDNETSAEHILFDRLYKEMEFESSKLEKYIDNNITLYSPLVKWGVIINIALALSRRLKEEEVRSIVIKQLKEIKLSKKNTPHLILIIHSLILDSQIPISLLDSYLQLLAAFACGTQLENGISTTLRRENQICNLLLLKIEQITLQLNCDIPSSISAVHDFQQNNQEKWEEIENKLMHTFLYLTISCDLNQDIRTEAIPEMQIDLAWVRKNENHLSNFLKCFINTLNYWNDRENFNIEIIEHIQSTLSDSHKEGCLSLQQAFLHSTLNLCLARYFSCSQQQWLEYAIDITYTFAEKLYSLKHQLIIELVNQAAFAEIKLDKIYELWDKHWMHALKNYPAVLSNVTGNLLGGIVHKYLTSKNIQYTTLIVLCIKKWPNFSYLFTKNRDVDHSLRLLTMLVQAGGNLIESHRELYNQIKNIFTLLLDLHALPIQPTTHHVLNEQEHEEIIEVACFHFLKMLFATLKAQEKTKSKHHLQKIETEKTKIRDTLKQIDLKKLRIHHTFLGRLINLFCEDNQHDLLDPLLFLLTEHTAREKELVTYSENGKKFELELINEYMLEIPDIDYELIIPFLKKHINPTRAISAMHIWCQSKQKDPDIGLYFVQHAIKLNERKYDQIISHALILISNVQHNILSKRQNNIQSINLKFNLTVLSYLTQIRHPKIAFQLASVFENVIQILPLLSTTHSTFDNEYHAILPLAILNMRHFSKDLFEDLADNYWKNSSSLISNTDQNETEYNRKKTFIELILAEIPLCDEIEIKDMLWKKVCALIQLFQKKFHERPSMNKDMENLQKIAKETLLSIMELKKQNIQVIQQHNEEPSNLKIYEALKKASEQREQTKDK